MIRRPPDATRTGILVPYTTRIRSDDLRDTRERGGAPAFPGEDVAQPADTGSFRRRLRQREIDVQLWVPTVGRATRIDHHGRRPDMGLDPAQLAVRVATVQV